MQVGVVPMRFVTTTNTANVYLDISRLVVLQMTVEALMNQTLPAMLFPINVCSVGALMKAHV
jgi:hypothetical protein